MSPIAEAIYQVLRIRTPKPVARKALIPYSELVTEVMQYEGIPEDLEHRKDPRLDEALLELIPACKADNQPQIAALVTPTGTYAPLDVFAKAAYPDANTPEAILAAWEKDLKEVAMTFFPDELST